MSRENGSKPFTKIFLLELPRSDVHTDRHIQTLPVPELHLCQRRIDDPLPHRNGQRMVFHRQQKLNGGQQAFFGVLPADQGFSTHHLTAAHIDFGLVKQDEFTQRQCHFHAP